MSESPCVTLHGVLLEAEGLGVLLTGASGAGKSASALELIQRGARLVADDAPEFRLNPGGKPEGRCPALLRDFIEVQGLGLLDIRALYGAGALRERVMLDLVIELVAPGILCRAGCPNVAGAGMRRSDPPATLARPCAAQTRSGPPARALHGPDYQTRTVLGVAVPKLTLHLAPGYSAAPWIEVLVRNHKLRLNGYQAQHEFLERHARALRWA